MNMKGRAEYTRWNQRQPVQYSVLCSVQSHYQAAELQWTADQQLLHSQRASYCSAVCLLVLHFRRRYTLNHFMSTTRTSHCRNTHYMHAISNTRTHTRCADGQDLDTRNHRHALTHTGNKGGMVTQPDLPPGLPEWTPRGRGWQWALANWSSSNNEKSVLTN